MAPTSLPPSPTLALSTKSIASIAPKTMADTAPVAAASIPQPGDGAYLARPTPQPGDGAYLTQRVNPGPSRAPKAHGRGRGRRPGHAANGSVAASEPPTEQFGALSVDPSSSRGPRNGRGKGRNNAQRQSANGTADGTQGQRSRPPRGQGRSTERGELANGESTHPSANGVSMPLNPAANAFTPDEGGSSRPDSRASQTRSKQRKPKSTETEGAAAPKAVSSRRAAFERGTKLTTGDAAPKKDKARKHVDHEPRGPEPDDLNSRLTRGLRGKPFIECPIVSIAIAFSANPSASTPSFLSSRRGHAFRPTPPSSTLQTWRRMSAPRTQQPTSPPVTRRSTFRVSATGLHAVCTTMPNGSARRRARTSHRGAAPDARSTGPTRSAATDVSVGVSPTHQQRRLLRTRAMTLVHATVPTAVTRVHSTATLVHARHARWLWSSAAHLTLHP